MNRLAQKLEDVSKDRGEDGDIPTIVLIPSPQQAEVQTLPKLIELLLRDEVQLNKKIGFLFESLKPRIDHANLAME